LNDKKIIFRIDVRIDVTAGQLIRHGKPRDTEEDRRNLKWNFLKKRL
jgi:hypothetical protein